MILVNGQPLYQLKSKTSQLGKNIKIDVVDSLVSYLSNFKDLLKDEVLAENSRRELKPTGYYLHLKKRKRRPLSRADRRRIQMTKWDFGYG